MINTSTIDKLIEMHMTPMADAFRAQMSDEKMKAVPFEDRFGMLVDIEYTNRKNKTKAHWNNNTCQSNKDRFETHFSNLF